MAGVTADALFKLLAYDPPPADGEPDGIFEARGTVTGDTGGASNTLRVRLTRSVHRGRIFVIRRVLVQCDDAATDYNVVYRSGWHRGEDVAMQFDSSLSVRQQIMGPMLFEARSGADALDMIQVTTANINGEQLRCLVQGDYWLKATLRANFMTPRIRW